MHSNLGYSFRMSLRAKRGNLVRWMEKIEGVIASEAWQSHLTELSLR